MVVRESDIIALVLAHNDERIRQFALQAQRIVGIDTHTQDAGIIVRLADDVFVIVEEFERGVEVFVIGVAVPVLVEVEGASALGVGGACLWGCGGRRA